MFGLIQVPFRFWLSSVLSGGALNKGKVTEWVRGSAQCDGVMAFVRHTLQRGCGQLETLCKGDLGLSALVMSSAYSATGFSYFVSLIVQSY